MLGGHYLRHNHSTRVPSSVVFLDTETRQSSHPTRTDVILNTFRLGFASAHRIRDGQIATSCGGHFDTPDKFWDWLTTWANGKPTTWVFGHNVGFDLTVLGFWEHLENGVYTLKDPRTFKASRKDPSRPARPRRGYAVIEDPPVIIKCFDQLGNAYVFCDSYNYFGVSLSQMGTDLGLPKLEYPGDDVPDSVMQKYCLNDVAILRESMLRLMTFWVENDLGAWKATGPALAMAAYRHRFMPTKHRILIEPDCQAKRISRAAYYGGEVRCDYYGQVRPDADGTVANQFDPRYVPRMRGPVYILDVAAAYPGVMARCQYPYKHLETVSNPSIADAGIKLATFCGAGIVLVNSPVTPYPRRREGDTQYVTGRFWTALAGEELAAAVRMSQVEKIAVLALYAQADLFSSFVSQMWGLRKAYDSEGNKSMVSVCKLLMNGLYGKFGQRSPKWEDYPDGPAPIPWGVHWSHHPDSGEMRCWRSIGWNAQLNHPPGESPESFPAIAACVTAALREQMRELRRIAGPLNVLYQDTDSLHVAGDGYVALDQADLIGKGEIGRLRVVETVHEMEYRGPRNYTKGSKQVVAGLKESAEQIGPSTYLQKQWQRTRTIIESRPQPHVEVAAVQFTIREALVHGLWDDNGRVSPYDVRDVTMPPELEDALRPD